VSNNHLEFKFIFAPHNIDEDHVENLYSNLSQRGISVVKYSQINPDSIRNYNVLIIDNIGMLSSLYKYSEVAYIGGGFGSGIHNLLEAATFGKPVIFGPNFNKFQEAYDLIQVNGGFSIKNQDEFNSTTLNLLNNKSLLASSSEKSKGYVIKHLGATQTIMDHISV